uniref:WRKY transcription factor WRKY51 n=1 Tax=Leersia perrieri TaxID=77586 RepID=A0A0D9WCC7_9ORYZ
MVVRSETVTLHIQLCIQLLESEKQRKEKESEMTKMSSMRADGSVPKRRYLLSSTYPCWFAAGGATSSLVIVLCCHCSYLYCYCCRRQDVQKVVVSLKDHKVEQGPPADSWSWRKYGQKPIKGSPHPRGYYKCSSYRGCPARKQVDKCRNDASLLIITYTSDHNHDNSYATNSVQEHEHHSDRSDAGAALSNGMSLAEVTVSSSKLSEEESCDFFDELEELQAPASASPLPSLSFMVQESNFSDARTLL